MFPVSSVPVYFCYQGIVLSGTSSRVLPVSRSRGPSGPRPLLLPLFTGVRGIEILRTSPFGHSPKFAARNSHLAFADRHRVCRPPHTGRIGSEGAQRLIVASSSSRASLCGLRIA